MIWLGLLLVCVCSTNAQLTVSTSIAPELRECYLDPELMNRNNLPPATMQVLIDIIQKIEDNPNINMNLRQMSAIILHTYRQDGIEFHQPEINNMVSQSQVLPFAPTFHSFFRHRILLSRIISSDSVLANTTLNSKLKCAIHHMLSTTVDSRVRGDESTCSQLSQYRALRTVRNIKNDVEIINPAQLKSSFRRTHGNMRQFNPDDEIEYTNYEGAHSQKQIIGSVCPLLDGVVSTEWGQVSGGNLIAGIAAGTQPQQIDILELTKGSVLNYNTVQQSVSSLFPATLSGDLAEAVLIQGTERGSQSITIGAGGNWNSSQAHRHFMLGRNVNLEMTDPEIRGGIDGFVLGSSIASILSTYSTTKLSQLLDMYYSPRNGALNPNLRACNRRDLSQQIATNSLVSETYAFAAALDTNIPLRGTIIGGLDTLVTSAVTNFQTYTSNNMNDLSCLTSNEIRHTRTKTNLYIVLDSSWQYQAVYPAISYLVDSIEVGKFGSSITLLSAFDGSILVNQTFSPADFHSEYTLARHERMTPGVNLQESLTNIRIMMQQNLREESLTNYMGGNASVLLYMINSGNIQNNDAVFDQARILNETVPDLRILFATASNQMDNLWNLVRDMHRDIRPITLTTAGTNVEITMNPLRDRILEFGRRIVNPLCGFEFTAGSSGTRHFDDFLEPGYINYYAVSPNYFFGQHDNRRLRIIRASSGAGSLRICHSRSVVQPSANMTLVGMDENAIRCETIAGNGNVEINLQNPCYDYWTVTSCPPLYISVQSEAPETASSSITCTEEDVCRFPYNIRYQVEIADFGCFSGAASIVGSLLIVISAYILTFFTSL